MFLKDISHLKKKPSLLKRRVLKKGFLLLYGEESLYKRY
tara:strand:- start:241 stop:357 length:117 start_codon:yes stop_codon:yes gene_type:complete